MKVQFDQVKKEEVEFWENGFSYVYWYLVEKKGYSGVVMFVWCLVDLVFEGCGIEKYDIEGWILWIDFGELILLNCYFFLGIIGDVCQVFKMEFFDDFFKWVQELCKEWLNLVIVGDYNIVYCEMDIYDLVWNKKIFGFLFEEWAWMD